MAFWPYAKELQGHTNTCAKCSLHPQISAVWGCSPSDLPQSKKTLYILGDEKTFVCPLKLLSLPFVQSCVSLFTAYERGITPNGKLADETSLYREAMGLLSQYKDEAAAWYQKELDKRADKRKARR